MTVRDPDRERCYFRCAVCGLRYLDPAHRLGRAQERAHYDLHENDVDDPRYRAFLGRLTDPLLASLPPGAVGLDYGCGPGPALIAMLEEAGHRMSGYDPAYRPDTVALERTYDFITCTETAEHFHAPAAEFERFAQLIRPGGLIAAMTCFQTDDARFARWHYRADPTHVAFYREATMHWIASHFGWSIQIPRKDVAIFRTPRQMPEL